MDSKKPAATRGKKRKKEEHNAYSSQADLAARQVEPQLHSLSRASLEVLVANSIRQNAPVTLELLQRAQPPKQPKAAPPQSRIGTGAFDLLDHSIVEQILGYLPLQDRIICATSVCQAWRQDIRTEMPALWNDLTQFRPTAKKHAGWKTHLWWKSYLRAEWILKLLDWLPSPENISVITIPTTDSCTPQTAKNIITRLADLQEKHPDSPRITKIVLTGKKISAAVLKHLEKRGLVGPHLQSFILREDVKVSKLEDVVLDLLAKCPNLQELRLPANMVRLPLYLHRLQMARHHNPTVLRVLDLSEGYLYDCLDQITVQQLASLATACPELEVLHLKRLAGLPLADFPLRGSSGSNFTVTAAEVFQKRMQAFPRLHTFSVQSFRPLYVATCTNSEAVQTLIPWLLAGMPALQNLFLSNGTHEISIRQQAIYEVPALPSIGTALDTLPRSLVRLKLQYLTVNPEDVALLTPQAFPALQNVELDLCKPQSLRVVQSLAPHWPLLRMGERGQNESVCLSSIIEQGNGFVPIEQA